MVSVGGEIINLAAYERLQFKVNNSASFVHGKISGTACITSIVVDQSNVKHFGIRSTRRLASVDVDSNGDSRYTAFISCEKLLKMFAEKDIVELDESVIGHRLVGHCTNGFYRAKSILKMF
jgi:hypothetical protein